MKDINHTTAIHYLAHCVRETGGEANGSLGFSLSVENFAELKPVMSFTNHVIEVSLGDKIYRFEPTVYWDNYKFAGPVLGPHGKPIVKRDNT